MATVIAPWTSTGFHPDGARFDEVVISPTWNRGYIASLRRAHVKV